MKLRSVKPSLFAFALALAPILAGDAAAQTCRIPIRFQATGGVATYCLPGSAGCTNDLNKNFGDWGSIFMDAITPGCESQALTALDQKVSAQNAYAPQSWQQWLGGGDVYLMTAAALRLGDLGMLTPAIHGKIKTALASYGYVLGPNGACANNTGNSCMDNYTVAAEGNAWAGAYLAITQDSTSNGRTASYFTTAARDYLKKSFSQTESVCVHLVSVPINSCTTCAQFADSSAGDLQNRLANGSAEVLTYEHAIENPNYGIGLLTLVSNALQGLKVAGSPYTPTTLERVIAHGLFRTGQRHLGSGFGACGATWANNCPRIACSGCTACTSANQTTASCVTDTCAPESCADFGYNPGMYPVYKLIVQRMPLSSPPTVILTVDPNGNPYYDFYDFCAGFFSTTDGFWHDGRRATYNELADVWPSSQPPLGGLSTNCPHSMCTLGAPIPGACSPCAQKVCSVDPYCCQNGWDSLCRSRIESLCGFKCS